MCYLSCKVNYLIILSLVGLYFNANKQLVMVDSSPCKLQLSGLFVHRVKVAGLPAFI